MDCFNNYRYLSVVLLIISTVIMPPVFSLRIRLGQQGLSAGFDLSPSIFRDDYGTVLKESDCPTRLDENPKFVYNNDTHYSSYFSLYCLARYPVTIDFDGNKPFVPIITYMVANANPDNMKKACYVLHLSQHFYREWTSPVGNYTCRSVQNATKASWYQIFAQNSWGFRFQASFNAVNGQTVYINEGNVSRFVIPCPANRETLRNPILKKYEKETGEETDITKFKGFNVSYDLHKGFTVDYSKPADIINLTTPSSLDNSASTIITSRISTVKLPTSTTTSVTGKYVCVDPYGLNNDVTVKHADFMVFPNRTKVTFDNGFLTFECYSNKPVSLIVLDNSSKLIQSVETPRDEFASLGFIYGSKSTFRTNDPNAFGKIACVEKSSSKSIYEWRFDNRYICTCEWNNTFVDRFDRNYGNNWNSGEQEFGETPEFDRHRSYPNYDWDYFDAPYYLSDLTCYNQKATSVDFLQHHCGNPTECDFVRKSCTKNENYCGALGSDYYYHPITTGITNRLTQILAFGPGFITCTADGYSSNLNVTTDSRGNMYFNDNSKKSDSEIIHIRSSESHVFMGDKMLYSCMASGSDVAHPVIWGFRFDDDGTYNYSSFNFDRYQMDDRLQLHARSISTMRASYLTIPKRRASQLYCFAPKWNSNDWVKTAITLNIEDADVADNPPKCPAQSNPIIVMYRNSSSISRNRVRLPHLVTGKDVLVFDPVEAVSLYCMAKFPVFWFKDGVNVTAARISRANCRPDTGPTKVGQLYKTTINFKVKSFNATGNYTCQSVSPHKSRQTSTYIYAMSPDNTTTFVDEGRHHIIRHKWANNSKDWENKKWAVLPCRLNTPNIKPYLFIDIVEEERIQKVSFNQEYLTFEPKVGFSIDVTNKKVVRGNKTVYFCSDHLDGSFIGTMITLELIYETLKPSQNANMTSTTTSPSPDTVTISPSNYSTTTHSSSQNVSGTSDKLEGSNTGFILTTVFLSAICLACLGTIYHLYNKIQIKQTTVTSQELDWTRAMAHSIPTNNGNGVIGNGIHSTISTHMNPEFIDTPNIIESLDSNSLIAHEQINSNDESLVDINCSNRDRNADFDYKKL